MGKIIYRYCFYSSIYFIDRCSQRYENVNIDSISACRYNVLGINIYWFIRRGVGLEPDVAM